MSNEQSSAQRQNLEASPAEALEKLLSVMARLRDPQTGCPWDLEQNFQTIAPYTIEETYEVVEAIEQGNMKALRDELGDLLFQVVFHAQMAGEQGLFDFASVANGVAEKMIERHPHVFGDREANTANAVLTNWESDKAAKRANQAALEGRVPSILDGITSTLPAMSHALKLQQRAARVGFDWTEAKDILAKLSEEIAELEVEMNSADRDKMEDELGDVLFVVVNLARHMKLDPETALRRTNRKFERRFKAIETALADQGRGIGAASLDEMERLWQQAKQVEK